MSTKENRPGNQTRAATTETIRGQANVSATYCTSFDKVLRAVIRIGGRIVAGVRGDAMTKDIQGSRHFLKRPPAIALDEDSIVQAKAAGVVYAEIRDTESGIVYVADLAAFEARGIKVDRGHGRQTALPIQSFMVIFPNGRVQLPAVMTAPEIVEDEAAQLDLFAEVPA